jgi:hypothetical protein
MLGHETANLIQHEHHFSYQIIADWGMFCREAMLVFLGGFSEKIGGPNKTFEIERVISFHTIGDTLLMASVCLAG